MCIYIYIYMCIGYASGMNRDTHQVITLSAKLDERGL